MGGKFTSTKELIWLLPGLPRYPHSGTPTQGMSDDGQLPKVSFACQGYAKVSRAAFMSVRQAFQMSINNLLTSHVYQIGAVFSRRSIGVGVGGIEVGGQGQVSGFGQGLGQVGQTLVEPGFGAGRAGPWAWGWSPRQKWQPG